MHPDSMREMVRQYIEGLFGEKKLELADELLTDDYVRHDATAPVNGSENLKPVLVQARDSFPDFSIDVREIVVSGNTAAALWSARGSMEGPFAGFAPTGRSFAGEGMSWFRFRDGRIAEVRVARDRLALVEQLGLAKQAAAADAD